jgi:hypothetical protein
MAKKRRKSERRKAPVANVVIPFPLSCLRQRSLARPRHSFSSASAEDTQAARWSWVKN